MANKCKNPHNGEHACEPIVTAEKVWQWKHAFNCDCIKKCPLSFNIRSYEECVFKGILPDLKIHVSNHLKKNIEKLERRIKEKDCSEKCCIDRENGMVIHASDCGSRIILKCLLCGKGPIEAKHLMNEHGCSNECPYLKGMHFHHPACEGWVMKCCQFCGACNVKSEHILKELGCGAECRLEQMIDEDGVLILVRHKSHKGKDDGSTIIVGIN